MQSASLAHLVYAEELQVKDKGLRLFWKHHKLAGQPEQVVPSPKPRAYRTTSKRKTILHGQTLHLLLGEKMSASGKKDCFLPSPLEPPEHEHIYRFLQQKLSEPSFRLVATHLNYIIIRGSYSERAVIFNVNMMNGPLVRKLKILAGHLQKTQDFASAAFAYLDPTNSDYYLENRKQDDALHLKKLFGHDQLAVSHKNCRYRFHPTSFSQVNESMVPVMLDLAREMLAPATDEFLLDLYCGYGLFSHYLAPDFHKVVAIDFEGPSIKSAIANSRLNKNRGGHITFLSHRISPKSLEQILSSSIPDSIILDPPRQGPQKDVIKTLSAGHQRNVLHIFCGVDQIPDSLDKWRKNGYQVRRIVPLDMFPGTANLEVMVLLTPKD